MNNCPKCGKDLSKYPAHFCGDYETMVKVKLPLKYKIMNLLNKLTNCTKWYKLLISRGR